MFVHGAPVHLHERDDEGDVVVLSKLRRTSQFDADLGISFKTILAVSCDAFTLQTEEKDRCKSSICQNSRLNRKMVELLGR